MAASVEASQGSADGLVDYASHRADLTFLAGDGKRSEEVIFDGSAMYLRLNDPEFGTGAKPWQKFSGPGRADRSGALFPLGDPTTALQHLRDKASQVSTIGHDDVRGVPTTRYRAVLAKGGSSGALPTKGPIDAWIDSQGRLRRLGAQVVTTVPTPTVGQFTSTFTMDLYDFGVAVNITLPPASQVLEFDSSKPMEGVTPNGPWTKTAAGTTAGVNWEVFTASGGPNELCVSVSTSPDLGGIAIQRTVQGASQFRSLRSEGLVYEGRPANCVPDPAMRTTSLDAPWIDPFDIIDADNVHQTGSGPHYFAALVDPRSTDVVALFSDGSTQALAPSGNVVFFAWRGNRELAHVELTPPRSGRMRCGSGNDGGILREPAGASCYNENVQTP